MRRTHLLWDATHHPIVVKYRTSSDCEKKSANEAISIIKCQINNVYLKHYKILLLVVKEDSSLPIDNNLCSPSRRSGAVPVLDAGNKVPFTGQTVPSSGNVPSMK